MAGDRQEIRIGPSESAGGRQGEPPSGWAAGAGRAAGRAGPGPDGDIFALAGGGGAAGGLFLPLRGGGEVVDEDRDDDLQQRPAHHLRERMTIVTPTISSGRE